MDDQSFPLTDADRALLPDATDLAFYAEHGWWLSPKLFTDDEIDTLLDASERFYAGHRDRRLPRRPKRLSYWVPDMGDVQRHNDYIHYEDATIGALLRKPLIGAVAARLARTDAIRIFQATLIYKPPRRAETSNVVPWHFDRDYWATSTSDNMLTAFIPLHDCTVEMGTIEMIDGSHLWKERDRDAVTSRHFAEIRQEADAALRATAAHNGAAITRVPVEIPRGHMSFHHCRVYHGSDTNRSPLPRRAISLHLQDRANAYRTWTLPDGTTAEYNHDVLVRRTPDGRPDYADPEFCPTIWRDPHAG